MQKVFNKHLNEKYFFTRIGNLPVFIIPKKGINEKVGVLAVNYGSIDNSWRLPNEKNSITVPEGIAHFLEHQQFKKEACDIGLEFARFGAMHNAGTGNTSTTYYFMGADNFLDNLNILLKLVLTSYFNPGNVAKEKSIIEQELRMYNDMPGFKVYDNLMTNLYKYHPVRISIGGTVDSVRTITPELLAQCYKTFYQPANMVLVLCGDFQESRRGDLEPEIGRIIETLNQSPYLKDQESQTKIVRNMPEEPVQISNYSSEEKMSTSTSSLLIGYKEARTGLEGLPFLKQNILSDMILDLIFSKSSKLYSKLYEDKLIDDRFGCGYSSHQTYGFTVISAETDQPEALYKRIMGELDKLAKNKICGQRELEQQKRKMIGKFTWVFNSPMAIASLFAGYYFSKILNMPKPGQEIYEIAGLIKKITLSEIHKRIREQLNPKYHAISVIKPLSNK
ncbi:MAG TPA: pitrilysin family protein [Planctomycetota bacterium]|nr:pitrilysin family protein [Planctomycetota bacterium]